MDRMDREPTSVGTDNWPHIPTEVAAATASARRIATLTDNGQDLRFLAARRGALSLASSVGAELVLFDVTSATVGTNPYGRGPVSSDNEELYSAGERLLGPAELELLGREYLSVQLHEASDAGVHCAAWLAHGDGLTSLPEFVARFQPDVIVAPETLDGAPRLVGASLEIDPVLEAAGDRPVILATVESLRLAGAREDDAASR